MKNFFVLSVLLFAGVAHAAPSYESNHRWALVPDNEGHMHLMDLNPIEVEPEPAFNADNDVFFVLFTRRNPTAGQRLSFNAAAIRSTNWNSAAPGTRFIIHGFNNNHQSPVNVDITRAYLARADHNVVAVDWGVGANTINYISARNRVPEVATVVARFIDFLHQNSLLIQFERLIIAGHSLGAHIAGITGKRVTRGRVQAIYGLDPAGPLFNPNQPFTRFASGDAFYTEMIATNAGTLGMDQPLADGNFYPNWGSSQPGCGLDPAGTCAHGRAVSFYAESVNSNRFTARRCTDYNQIRDRNCPGQGGATMGGDDSKLLSGVFFLDTNSNSPFARG